jgi:signal transduction histidine kinase
MSFLRDFVELITTPTGSLVYHLVTLFAIQIILAIAFGHWNRNRRDAAATRLLVAGVGFTIARILLMLIAVLASAKVISPYVVLPPLERFLDLATLLLAVWAFLPILERHSRPGVALLLLTLLIITGVYVAFATLWPRAEAQFIAYNSYWQEMVWELASITILVLALAAGLIWREDDWSLVTCLFALWLTGHVLQLAIPLPDSHAAGYVWLVNLAALPLIASLVYRRVLNASPAPATGGGAGLELISILGAAQRIEATRDVEAALRSAAPSIAHALGADMIAIGLPVPGLAKKIRIVALHPSTGTMLAHPEPMLLASRHPLVATAIETGSLQRASAPDKDPTIVALYHRLGFEHPGPLLAQPMVDEGALLGVILAGNSVSQRRWTMRDEQIFQAMGAAITTALVNASRRETADRSAELKKALDEARCLAERAAELEAELEHQRQRAEELSTKLRLREQKDDRESQAQAEVAIWQEEMHKLTEASLQKQAALEAELAEWKDRAVTPRPEEGAIVRSDTLVSLIHELRTPMASIAKHTNLLLGESVGILGEMQCQLLRRINANTERVEVLLEDLVKATTIDTGQVSLSPDPVNLTDVVGDAVTSLSATHTRRPRQPLSDRTASPIQCLPVLRARRQSTGQCPAERVRRPCRWPARLPVDVRDRYRRRHCPRGPTPDLPSSLPGRQPAHRRSGRHRRRPLYRQSAGRNARRPHLGGKRDGSRQHLQFHPAALL